MTDNTAPAPLNGSRLQNFPISFFSMIMGLGGFAAATAAFEKINGMTNLLSMAFTTIAIAIFGIFVLIYLLKFLRHRDAVIAEWHHPIKVSFFPAVTISMLILAICFESHQPHIAKILWWIAAPLNLLATFLIISKWMKQDHYKMLHMGPVWFIPVVGNVIAPIAGMHIAPMELNWFLFSVGIMFWIVLLPIIMNRLFFHEPVPGFLMPSLFIFIAPPAVAFISFTQLTMSALSPFAIILYNAALFFFMLMLFQLNTLRKLPFTLSWWAYSFPVAAMTLATFKYAHISGTAWFASLGSILYLLLSAIIIMLLIRTMIAMLNKTICVEGH